MAFCNNEGGWEGGGGSPAELLGAARMLALEILAGPKPRNFACTG